MRLSHRVMQFAVAAMLLSLSFSVGSQQSKKVPRTAYLTVRPSPSPSPGEQAFMQGLQELGYVEGKTITIERRWTIRQAELAELAAELVRLKVDVLVAAPTPAVQAAKNATSTIPLSWHSLPIPCGQDLLQALRGQAVTLLVCQALCRSLRGSG